MRTKARVAFLRLPALVAILRRTLPLAQSGEIRFSGPYWDTWTHFRNLESMDDRVRLASPPDEPHVYRMVDYEYRQPVDRARYKRAPSCLRICYPSVAFHQNEVAIAYDYGYGVGELNDRSTTKIKIVTLDWLYGRG